MPTHEEVIENIKITQNHRNIISKLSIDTGYYTSKEAALEDMIMQLYNYYFDLSGSVEKIRKLVELKLGGVK